MCIVTTGFMVGYWIYKFHKNEDITAIEYYSRGQVENVIYPELTICVLNPFLTEKLQEINKFLDHKTYLKYLKGEDAINETYKDIDYDHVTFDLYDHFQTLYIRWKNGKIVACTDKNICPFAFFKNSYNGFGDGHFLKCFALEINATDENVPRAFSLTFNVTLERSLKHVGKVQALVNHPQQFSRVGIGQHIWRNPEESNFPELLKILSIETVRQRNKRNKPCEPDWMSYDTLLLEKHIEKVGCRAPYQQKYQNFPICNTLEQMKKSYFEHLSLATDHPLVPCQSIPDIPYTYTQLPDKTKGFAITITYPNNVKIVTQSQAVDVHSLIGNMGGYIGLFMGK
jgi:hypothetical protein